MAYKPNKTTALFFSIAIIVFGTIMALRTEPDIYVNGPKSPPHYFDIGVIVVGTIGLALIWLNPGRKPK